MHSQTGVIGRKDPPRPMLQRNPASDPGDKGERRQHTLWRERTMERRTFGSARQWALLRRTLGAWRRCAVRAEAGTPPEAERKSRKARGYDV